jgi:hypothetical protein
MGGRQFIQNKFPPASYIPVVCNAIAHDDAFHGALYDTSASFEFVIANGWC